MANTDGYHLQPTKKEYEKFVDVLDKPGSPKHYRVMRRTYNPSDPNTYVLIWKNPQFSNGSTAPYIAIDIHYENDQDESGHIGGVFAKGVFGVDLKPETDKQILQTLTIPMCKYLMSEGLSKPPKLPLELQDFDNDFNLKANRATQNLDAYQDGNGHRRR